MSSLPQITDIRDERQLSAYFTKLAEEFPEIVEALRVMNISYRDYLAALQALNRQSSVTTSSTKLRL